MRIPFLGYITPRIFLKIKRDHRLKANGTIISSLLDSYIFPSTPLSNAG